MRHWTRIVARFLRQLLQPARKPQVGGSGMAFDAVAAARIIPNMSPTSVCRSSVSSALLVVAFAALTVACSTAPSALSGQKPIASAEARAVLDAQVARWNQGDLRGFVETYWDGPELTFFGRGGLTRGRSDLLQTYQRGYPTDKERGVLSFSIVDFRALGSGHALLLGRYHIDREQPADGVFSLVLARKDGKVVILHDHSTEGAPVAK